MKSVSADYIASEEADERKPVEIYTIWRHDDSQFWYYTDGDVTVTYDGNDYLPATLKRSGIAYDNTLDVTTMSIQAAYLETPLLEYISQNPIESIWISIKKLFRDQSPLEASIIFIGQIKNVSFKGVAATINCVGFEHFLSMPIPTWRYQLTCNLKLYDDKCKVVKSGYKLTTSGTLDAAETTLTSSDFGLEDDGYYNGGTVEYGSASRTIVSHVSNDIALSYKIIDLEDWAVVDVYPGCDLRIETCKDNYDNVINFMGTPFIPIDNPAMRTK